MSLTKEQLSDRIRQALAADLRAFIEQQSDEESAYQEKITHALTQAGLAPIAGVAQAWRDEAKRLRAEKPDHSIARRQEAALAFKIIANEFRLPLELRQVVAESAKSGKGAKAQKESGKRMKRADMQKLLEAVLGALPADGAWVRNAELVEKTGAASGDVRSALLRLKREGKAESNGRKGLAGAWKRK